MIVTVTLASGTIRLQTYATSRPHIYIPKEEPAETAEEKAPTVITGDNMYIVWFVNVGTVDSNYEVGFRASTDNEQTFGPITNVSNSGIYDSVNAEISAEGDNVIVSTGNKMKHHFYHMQKYQRMGDKHLEKDSILQTVRLELLVG